MIIDYGITVAAKRAENFPPDPVRSDYKDWSIAEFQPAVLALRDAIPAISGWKKAGSRSKSPRDLSEADVFEKAFYKDGVHIELQPIVSGNYYYSLSGGAWFYENQSGLRLHGIGNTQDDFIRFCYDQDILCKIMDIMIDIYKCTTFYVVTHVPRDSKSQADVNLKGRLGRPLTQSELQQQVEDQKKTWCPWFSWNCNNIEELRPDLDSRTLFNRPSDDEKFYKNGTLYHWHGQSPADLIPQK
jgi:hypothetical protein